MSKEARQGMTDRQLLESLHERLDGIDARLGVGDKRFGAIDADWTLAMHFLQAVALERSRPDLAAQIEATIKERRPPNGADHPDLSDEPTNPGG